MASASSMSINAALSSPVRFSCSILEKSIFPVSNRPSNLAVSPTRQFRSSSLSLSRRQKYSSSKAAKKKKKIPRQTHGGEEDDFDEDAFEALFKQLEEDLKNDDPSFDDVEDDISEGDLAKLEQELAEALGDDDLEMSMSNAETNERDDDAEANVDDEEHDEGDDDGDEDDNDIERPVEIKRWQLRRLAAALKTGRRKTSIKNLAADLCLDRSVVLKLLRDPPPNLLMMSAMLPDEAPKTQVVPENRPVEVAPIRTASNARESDDTKLKEKVPLHVMHQTWSSQKRLKKVQVQTLERVYRKTKRPTNAMIRSIVQVTSLPRNRIVKWFEDRRSEDGVPDQHLPYQRPVPETVA